MRRPTLLADQKHAALPLHASQPHVPYVNWEAIDALVVAHSNAAEERVYAMCKVYREEAAAAALYAELPVGHRNEGDAALLGDDIETLQVCEFAAKTSTLQCNSTTRTVKVFSVVELQKNRRRVITWPKQLNRVEREHLRTIRAEGGQVLFPTIEGIVKNAKLRFSAQADFVKYFQQFPLEQSCRKYFTFGYRGSVYEILTVPTGAVSVPLWAQVITRCIALAAIRKSQGQFAVFFDCVIDNVRFVSDNLQLLGEVWSNFLQICKDLSVTVGVTMPPAANTYSFLGIQFTTSSAGCCIAIAAKTHTKLLKAASILRLDPTRRVLAIHEVLAFFGICIFAATVAAATTGGQTVLHSRNHFMIFKYIRRIGHRTAKIADWKTALDLPVDVWPCIIREWEEWCLGLAIFNELLSPLKVASSGALYTDASDSGWGIVFFGCEGRVFSAGGKWTSAEKKTIIAEREIRATTIGLDIIEAKWPLIQRIDLFIDNTNAISWITKGRSRRYAANEMCAKIAHHKIRITTLTFVASAANKADVFSRPLYKSNAKAGA